MKLASCLVPVRLAALLLGLVILLAAATASGPPGKNGRTAPYRTWAALYGGPEAEAMEGIWATSDGGFIVAGETESYGHLDGDAWLLKLDAYGNVMWQKTYGGPRGDMLTVVRQTNDGGYVAAGWTKSFGAGKADMWVVKLDAAGAIQWQKTYGGAQMEQAWSIVPVSSGGYIIAGGTTSFGAGGADYWVLKLADNGAVQWQKTYGGPGNDGGGGVYAEFVVRVLEDEDGNFVVASHTASFGHGDDDIWIIKLGTGGNIIWEKAYGGSDEDSMYSFQEASGGGYIVPGVSASFNPDWSGDLWTLKLAKSGNIEWEKIYRIPGDWNEALTLGATSDGGALIGGYYEEDTDWDLYLLRLDATGGVLWKKLFERGWDWPNAIQQLPDGGFIVAGVVWPNDLALPEHLLVMRLGRNGGISPSCAPLSDLNLTPANTESTVINTNATVTTTNVTAQNSSASVADTTTVPDFLCQGQAFEIFIGLFVAPPWLPSSISPTIHGIGMASMCSTP